MQVEDFMSVDTMSPLPEDKSLEGKNEQATKRSKQPFINWKRQLLLEHEELMRKSEQKKVAVYNDDERLFRKNFAVDKGWNGGFVNVLRSFDTFD